MPIQKPFLKLLLVSHPSIAFDVMQPQGRSRLDAYGPADPNLVQHYQTVRSFVGIQNRVVQQMMPKVPLVSGPGDKKSADKEACHDPEEACDEDKFGDENKGPTQSECWKPLLPLALSGSTILGGVTVTLVHVPLLTELTAWPWSVFVAIVLAIYGPTLLCMLWVARADPGQITIEDGETPKRTHKSWLYPEPIRRYDHYCRWLQNVVGLMNHREFMAMLIGLTLIAVLGVIMDPALAVLAYKKPGVEIVTGIILVLHWIYSLIVLFFEGEIFIIHVGLVSRNETAQEWKQNKYYVAHDTSKGDNIHVESLSDSDEYNELLDNGEFVYSPETNSFDKGCPTNCFNFWCEPRWDPQAKGDF
ncbi:erf2 [Symbiodinium microadriaticum]|nr:erf2 [Symbiodinium microadriaticum]